MYDQPSIWQFDSDDSAQRCEYSLPMVLSNPSSLDCETIRELYTKHATNDSDRTCTHLIDSYIQMWCEKNRIMVIRCYSHGQHQIVASVSLGMPLKLKGRCGVIEDVITHRDHRRRGLAKMIMEEQMRFVDHERFVYTDLTNRDDRGNAKLYTSLGFKERSTSVYRRTLSKI